MNGSNKNLLDIVDEQKKTIEKYSQKLRDVVAAHKSLLIEKKALEDTIKILNEAKSSEGKTDSLESGVEKKQVVKGKDEESKSDSNSSVKECEDESKDLLTTLSASISNLVAEKSYMEESFKVNQKQLLDDKKIVENKCKELQEEVKALKKQLKNVENKSLNEFFFARKDPKRHSKGKSQNANLKCEQDEQSKTYENELLILEVKNYEKEVKNLKSELEAKKMIHELSEKKLKEYSCELNSLQEQVRNLQLEHQAALQLEKEKARNVEEEAKKLTAIQEERVVNLETRLAELSETIGSYDRLRLQDQNEIQKLKEHITHADISQKGITSEPQKVKKTSDDYGDIVDKILKLKEKLQVVAVKCGKEDDFKRLFSDNCDKDTSHSLCKEEYNKLKTEFELFKNEVKLFNNQPKIGKEVLVLQNQVKNLQEKIKILSEKNKEIKKEYTLQIDQLMKTMKEEKERFKEAVVASELDFRGRVWLFEEQLQKQRERSLAMLEEKEQEINSLQSTFQMLMPGYVKLESKSGKESEPLSSHMVDGTHIVHYTNELARRDIEISSLRRRKYQIETAFRNLQKEMVSFTEKQDEERHALNAEISRLKRCQTREGANLEYLKNVIYSFLLSSDPKSKRHMCNAIAAVLNFTENELKTVTEHSKNKWWSNSGYM